MLDRGLEYWRGSGGEFGENGFLKSSVHLETGLEGQSRFDEPAAEVVFIR